MRVIIPDSKLKQSFSSMMRDYSDLEHAEKAYDYWSQERSRYIDFNVVNYYDDIEMDWEDDSWILQYQTEPGDFGEPKQLPILRYGEWYFRNIITLFGVELFESLLGQWFKETYGWEVKTVTSEDDNYF
jgi:hypothetical protein